MVLIVERRMLFFTPSKVFIPSNPKPMNTRKRSFLSLRCLILSQLCLIPGAALIHAQTAPAPSTAAAVTAADTKDVVVLTPFEVVSSTKGYYASNTMSGTRFNAKLSDLASSVTVLTKDQMTDFGMIDINDAFLYVAGTEGSGTFTDYTLDRNGSISDNTQLNPAQANRVRGIAPANVSMGNIETMARVPIDPIGIDALEVSRGPNANVFGLGNASGTVNQVPSSANLQKDKLSIGARVDSFEGYRQSLDVNRVLIQNKLAVRFQEVYQHEGFIRKPSGVDTKRFNAMIKYRPFKNTTLSASYNYYKADGTRTNSIPPRDNISYWIKNGKPTWDPVARVIKVGGLTSVPITATAFPTVTTYVGDTVTNTRNTDFFSATYLGFNDSQLFIDQGGTIGYWAAPAGVVGSSPNGSNFGTVTGNSIQGAYRYLATTGTGDARGTGVRSVLQPLFVTTPTINDKSVYDYENINMGGANYFLDKTETYAFQLDHVFVHNPFHTLALQANFFREDSDRYTRNVIGIANDLGQSGQLFIDINEKRLDGSVNPYFLRPYIGTDKPRTSLAPAKWDTYRAQLAYRIDLTKKEGGLKWLGTHQATVYDEYKYRVNKVYSWRDVMTDSHAWIPAGTYRGNQSTVVGVPANLTVTKSNYRYYVGDATGNNVDFAPEQFSYGTYNYNWGNAATGVFVNEPATLGLGAVSDSTAVTLNSKTIIKTKGGVIQSHFLDGRIVTTFGLREDQVYTLFGQNADPKLLNTDGLTFDYNQTEAWGPKPRAKNVGKTKNTQVIVRPFRDAKFVQNMSNGSKGSSFFADVLNNMSLGFNKSDSFLPQPPRQDFYKNQLPNTTGDDKSYTAGFELFDGKLIIKATRYNNVQKNARDADASVFLQRVTRIDMSPRGQTANPARLLFQADAWLAWQNPTLTTADSRRALVTTATGMSKDLEDFLFDPIPPFAATADLYARGTEIEINYNPTNYWTMAGSVTDSVVVYRNVSNTVNQWITERMPIWTTIVDPRIGSALPGGLAPTTYTNAAGAVVTNTAGLWWNQRYAGATGNQTSAENFDAFVGAPYSAFRALEGKANAQGRRYAARFSTKVDLKGLTDHRLLKKFNVGGAVRWESKGTIGYYGMQTLPAKITDLDPNRPIYDKAHFYLDLFVGYKTKLWNDKVAASFNFNVKNLNQSVGLRPVGALPDGQIHTYRIVDPRQFILSATFEL